MPRLELVETSLRAGQQALLVSRMRQRHAIPVAQLLDGCGFAALDVFGGTTFEAQLRFLGEDPFDRLRAIREAAPNTRLMATIAGQSLVGHRHVADDVVDSFIGVLADAGIDMVRCYDPLNDVRNLERSVAATHARKLHAEGVVVFSSAGGDATGRSVDMAKQLGERGYDSICLYDPLGVLGVARAGELVSALREATSLPISISFSAQTGQADFAYVAAIEAGAVRVDVALSPLAGGASQPAAEALVMALRETPHDTGLDLDKVSSAALLLESTMIHYGDVVDPLALRLDTSALRGLLPPSAMGHALAELRDRDALERIAEVEHEVARVRSELGNPPLTTPLTEIIATQAVYNVCDGDRYVTISQEVKDYCLGLYGAPPTAVDATVLRIVNGRDEPITLRPADLLSDGMPPAREALAREGVEISDAAATAHAMFDDDWLALARGEVVIELLGDEPEARGAPEIGTESADGHDQNAPDAIAEPPPAPAQEVRDLVVEVDGQSYDVRVIGQPGSFGGGGSATVAAAPGKPVIREGTVVAPMQGMILKVGVAVGDNVELGQVVAVLEAMKMQNDITATKAGKVAEVFVKEGSVVGPRDPIVQIG